MNTHNLVPSRHTRKASTKTNSFRSPNILTIVSQVEIRAICPLRINGEALVTKAKIRLEEMLQTQYDGGRISETEMITTLVQYDAAYSTKVLARHTLPSTIIASVSAMASAAAAYFAYAALHIPR